MPGLVDTTLREGAQAPVGYLTIEQKRALVTALARIGVAEIELGHAVAETSYGGEPLAELMDVAAAAAPGVRRAIWCRAKAQDIEMAAALRPEVVSFALPVSDRHLVTRLRRNRPWALDQVIELVDVARSAGVSTVSIGLEDATRTDVGFLRDVAAAADWAGADRVRIADTVGIAPPELVTGLITEVSRVYGGEIGVHLHNDFGMATAGAIAAIQAGASWVDVSLLGLGERAGISRLEEVCAWLTLQAGGTYDLHAVRAIALRLAEWVERPIGAQAPILGSEIFACESGLHVAGIVRDPATYEPCPPEAVGAERSLRLGRNSGRAAVAALVPEAGDLTATAARVRAAAAASRRALDPADFHLGQHSA